MSGSKSDWQEKWRASALILGAGLAGYAIARLIGMPLPALLGPIAGAALLACFHPVSLPAALRDLGLLLLGLAIGATLTPESIATFLRFPLVMLLLALTTAGAMSAGYLIYRRIGGWNRQTAFLAAAPGALSTVLALMDARSRVVDMPGVTLAQTSRLAALVFLFPLAFHAPSLAPGHLSWPLPVVVGAAAAATACGVLFTRLRLPAGWLLGPALIIGLATAGGVIRGAPHPLLVDLGLGLLGCAVGVKLAQTRNPNWLRHLATIGLAFAAMMAVSALGVWIAHVWLQLPYATGFLALSPGGFEAMIAIAVAMNIDPALVSAAHVARIFGLTLALPVLWRLAEKPPASISGA